MLVELDITKDVVIQIPYNLRLQELVLEPDLDEAYMPNALHEILEGADEELVRVLTSALILHKVKGYPIKSCLNTAIVWERG